MIPNFDDHGNLPPGVYTVSFDELKERFGGPSLQRKKLTNELEMFYRKVCHLCQTFYIDGSYITKKVSPSDIDILIILPEDIKSRIEDKLFFFANLAQGSQNKLHIYSYLFISQTVGIGNLYRTFTKDRENNPKGILLIK